VLQERRQALEHRLPFHFEMLAQYLAVEPPDHLVALAGLGCRVLLEAAQEVVQEDRLAAARGAVEHEDLVLLRAAAEGVDHVHQPVGEDAVGEERLVGVLHEQAPEIVGDEVDRLGVLGVLVEPLAHVGAHHVVEDLVDVADQPLGVRPQQFQELGERDRLGVVQAALAGVQRRHRLADGVAAHSSPRLSLRSFMV
jgi:hypothetical protein